MRLKSIVGLVVVAFALAGCFTSAEPLITPATAAYPFTRVVYTEAADAQQVTLLRQGDSYAVKGETGTSFLFQEAGEPDLYYVQLTNQAGDIEILYGMVRVDTAAGTIDAYRLIAHPSDLGVGPGLIPECPTAMGSACLTDLNQLGDIVKAAIAAGEAPDGTFTILALE